MQKGKNVIGKDIVSFIDGKKVASVKDLVVGADNRAIVALLVDEGGLFSSSKIVPVESVISYGKDAVVISEEGAVVSADSIPQVSEILDRKEKLIGKNVMTEGGEAHGKISDVYFEEKSGQIPGFEVSAGFFKDTTTGNGYLSMEDVLNLGPDVALVKSEAAYTLEEQTGGLQAAFKEAKSQMGAAVKGAKGDTEEESTASPVGRRAIHAVNADDGSLIVALGQRITPRMVEQAETQNKTEELRVAAGLVDTAAARERAALTGERLSAANERIGEVAGVAAERAGAVARVADEKTGQLWDDFLLKVREWKDQAGQRVDEEKTKRRLSAIQDAIGRPVAKVILDRQDNVILNLGDIITHEGVQRAFDADMLETLLDNVYKGDVTFERDEMRANQEGQATVEKAHGEAPAIDQMHEELEQAKQEREQRSQTSREQADREREERRQEREAREQQRAAEAASGTGGSNGRSGSSAATATEPHAQASIPEEEFSEGKQ